MDLKLFCSEFKVIFLICIISVSVVTLAVAVFVVKILKGRGEDKTSKIKKKTVSG